MKTRFCLLLFAVSSWLAAQSVHLTVPAVDASGATVTTGTAYFTWQPFLSTNGTWVSGSQLTRLISSGVLDVTLAASDNAGYVYTVLIMNGASSSTFHWKVPTAGASSMAQLNQALSAPSLNATAIQGNPFKAGTPAASQTYIWNAATNQFELGTVSGGGVGALVATNNLSDLASASAARTNLGLGTAATQPATAFDASGVATAAVSGIPVSGAGQTNPALLSAADRTAFAAKQAALGFTPENSANKGVASGYAPLNASSQVPLANLPTIPFSQISGAQAALGYTAQNAAIANANNAGIGNCPTGQFATGTASGATQPCATPPAGTGSSTLPLNTNYALSTANTPGGGAPFTLLFNEHPYTSGATTTVDTQMGMGYNVCTSGTQCVSSEPAWFWGVEDKYLVSGVNYNEMYWQYQPTANGATRPIFVQVNRDTNNINDFELNSDPAVGIGFHRWDNNGVEWALMKGNEFSVLGYTGQTADTKILARGQSGFFGSLLLDNGTTGFAIQSVSDNANIWQLNMPNLTNWMQYNNTKTSIGGSGDFPGGATVSIEPPASSTNPVLSLKQAASDTANLLNLYSSAGTLLGNISSTGALTVPNVTDSALTAGQCVQAGTGGILTTTGAACGAGGGGGNTTSTSLVSGNIPVASGANAVIDSGIAAATNELHSSGNSPLILNKTGGTGGIQIGNGAATIDAIINNHGNATFGSGTDLAGTGSAIYAQGAITSAGQIGWASKVKLNSPADGQLLFTNNANTGFNYVCFAACTAAFPRINVNSNVLEVQLGDGSAYSGIRAGSFIGPHQALIGVAGVPATVGTGATTTTQPGSTNVSGSIVVSNGAGLTSFAMTFANAFAYGNRPVCMWSDDTTAAVVIKTSSYSTTTATATVASGTVGNGDTITYICSGY
jgi:hypothetical protein